MPFYRELAHQVNGEWGERFLIEDDPAKIDALMQKHPDDGWFMSTFAYENDNMDGDVSKLFEVKPKVGDLFFDFDHVSDLNKAREDALRTYDYLTETLGVESEMVRLWFSGAKGYHLAVSWRSVGCPSPLAELHTLYRRFADGVYKHVARNKTLDLSVYNARRMFRVPGSVHHKTGTRKHLVNHADLLEGRDTDGLGPFGPSVVIDYPALPPAPLLQKAMRNISLGESEKRDRTQRLPTEFLIDRLDCVQRVLTEGIPVGLRNDATYTIALYFRALGLDKKDTYEVIDKSGLHTLGDMDMKEAARTITSAFNSDHKFGLKGSVLEPFVTERDRRRWAGARIDEEYETLTEVVRSFIPDIDRPKSNVVSYYGVPELDKRLGGIIGGELVVLGGATGTGKSEFAFHVAVENARRGTPTAFITLELANRDFIGRLLRSASRVSPEKFWAGETDEAEKGRIREAAEKLASENLPLFFRKKKSTLSVEELEALVQSLIIEQGCRFIVIDHLHYMSGDTDFTMNMSDNSKVSRTMRAINSLCVKFGIGIICVAHFRKIQDPLRRPTMHEFKDSSSIEHEASTVLLLWRNSNGLGPEQFMTEFRLAKSRKDLALSTTVLKFNPDTRAYDIP